MATPLTDSINALTTYANEVTGASDTNLSDAVHTLASGYGQGGGASYDGIEIKTSGTTVTEYACHMSTIPDFALNYIDYTKGASDGLSQITFPVKPTHVGKRAFFQAKARIDWSGLSDMETADEYALASAYISQADWTGDEVTLSSFVGYTSSHNAQNLFRFDGSAAQTYCPKKYGLPVCEVIPQFMLYGIRASNIDVTIGSVGHAVTESKNQPFGATPNASGTVTIYTDGSHLDAVKTAVQENAGSNLTFVYKASEATTYGGNSYAAGATMLTA